jgi:hypothetical protein
MIFSSPPQRRTTPEGHHHAEAFCLMWYACHECGHRERMWNSRDGVTPFGTACPSCQQPTLQHTDFHRDTYAPNHQPALGQRIWVAMTRERAEFLIQVRLLAMRARGPLDITPERLKESVDSTFQNGESPDMMVVGYPQQRMTSKAQADVVAERRRQIDTEGWSAEHDDRLHGDSGLARAAAAYAFHAGSCSGWGPESYQQAKPYMFDPEGDQCIWPWDIDCWKPKDPRSDLVRACALGLAEIERIDRVADQTGLSGIGAR